MSRVSRTVVHLMMAWAWCLVAFASPARAQITSASVSGTVTDQTGGVLPGVDISIKSLDTGQTRSFVTSAEGGYSITGLQPGQYEVRATLQTFTPTVERIQLTVGQTAGLNLVM